VKKKIIVAILLNFVIVCIEIIAFIACLKTNGILTFTYYTTTSNFLALVVSFLFCVVSLWCLIKKISIPHWLNTFRFVSNVNLMVTFIISTFIIVPLYPNLFEFMLLKTPGIFQHVLCPLISLISFLLFEKQKNLSKNSIILALIPTISYGAINLTLNLLKITSGPYPFFYLFVVPWYVPVVCILTILTLTFLTIKFIYKFFNKARFA